MKCSCGSERILTVSGKVSDMCDVQTPGLMHCGYVPSGLNIGSGDYLEFNVCLDCGKLAGTFPITEEAVNEAFSE